ncbi:MAG: glucose-1-phosphate adenylyltransferase subunit GlgD [Marinisporobacter sp.]|jgi:glucose-1-phosphate adenylyltransferase|nr:glucose-1-phosphate adenylyltransferase subunit GlgD [Marinisporobacter sp.]
MMGIIYTEEKDFDLKSLTQKRSIAALPIWGRYRMIDFMLSNMVNSGIQNIGIITKKNYSSLMNHLATGKEWDLDRKKDGLFILTPYRKHEKDHDYKGSTYAFRSIMDYVKRSTQEYVLICGSHMICNLTYNDMLDFHIEKGADITFLYKEEKELVDEATKEYILMDISGDGRVASFDYHRKNSSLKSICMKMMIMSKKLFEELIEEGAACGKSDFIIDIISKNVDRLKYYAYPYRGYLAKVHSIVNYYNCNMDMLNVEKRNEIFHENGKVYTRIKDETPVFYGKHAIVKNSAVAEGCTIDGYVENSVIFRGVNVEKGANVQNCIVLPNCVIQENSKLENVILGKNVRVRRKKNLKGELNYPFVVEKGQLI